MHMLITKQLCLPLCSCKPFLHELMVVDAKLDENKVSDHASWPRTKVSDACHAAGTGRCRWRGNAKARAAAGQLAGRIWHCSNLRSHAAPVREMAQLLLPPVQRSWTASMHPCEFPVKLHQNSCHHKKEESLWFFWLAYPVTRGLLIGLLPPAAPPLLLLFGKLPLSLCLLATHGQDRVLAAPSPIIGSLLSCHPSPDSPNTNIDHWALSPPSSLIRRPASAAALYHLQPLPPPLSSVVISSSPPPLKFMSESSSRPLQSEEEGSCAIEKTFSFLLFFSTPHIYHRKRKNSWAQVCRAGSGISDGLCCVMPPNSIGLSFVGPYT
jgi:hypothetical protein